MSRKNKKKKQARKQAKKTGSSGAAQPKQPQTGSSSDPRPQQTASVPAVPPTQLTTTTHNDHLTTTITHPVSQSHRNANRGREIPDSDLDYQLETLVRLGMLNLGPDISDDSDSEDDYESDYESDSDDESYDSLDADDDVFGQFNLPIFVLEWGLKTMRLVVYAALVNDFTKKGISQDQIPKSEIRRAMTRVFALLAARKIYATIEEPSICFLVDEIQVIESVKFRVPWRIQSFIENFGAYDDEYVRFQPRYPGLLVSHLLWVYLATDEQLDEMSKGEHWLGGKNKWLINRCNVPLLLCDSSYLIDKWSEKLAMYAGLAVSDALPMSAEELESSRFEDVEQDPQMPQLVNSMRELPHAMSMTETEFKSMIGEFGVVVSGSKEEMMTRSREVSEKITPILKKYVETVYRLTRDIEEPSEDGNPDQISNDSLEKAVSFFQEGFLFRTPSGDFNNIL